MKITKHKEYLRSILFGTEDSLVSTSSFIAGISVGSVNARVVFFSALVAICIEGISMGVGEYLSDDTVAELDKLKRHKENPLLSGFLLCASYILAGLIPLLPISFFTFPTSTIVSVVFAFLGLFLLGYIRGKLLKVSPFKSGFKILVIGGFTALCGVLIGLVFR